MENNGRLQKVFLAFMFLAISFSAVSSGHAEVIIDNGKTGTSFTGNWAASGSAGSYGTTSVWARDGAKYTWTFTPATSGSYDVSMWWTEYSSRATNIPVTIAHAGGTATVRINQQDNGGQWNVLGRYTFTAGQSYKVTITSQANPTSTCADAVRFAQADGVNVAPVAANDTAATTEGAAVTVDVVSNDSDDGGIDPATVAVLGGASNGIAISNGNGTVTYTPDLDFTGTDTFSYTVADSLGLVSNEATVTVTVSAVSTEYVIDNGKAGTSFTGTWAASGATGSYGTASVWARDGAKYTWSFTPTTSGTCLVSMWWTAYSSRSASIPVTITHAGGTASVTINQKLNGSRWNGLGSYSFTAGQSYKVTITSQANPTSSCADAVKFTYLSVAENMPPVAASDTAATSLNAAVTVNVASNDSDDGTLNLSSLAIASQPSHGTAVSNGNGTVTYTPAAGYSGSDSFTYKVSDTEGLISNAATVTVTVSAANTPPVAGSDSAVTTAGTAVTINVLANDTDDGTINTASVTIAGAPASGNAAVNGNGTITYTPSGGFTGSDSFSYKVSDTLGMQSNAATVSVTVNAANVPPTAVINSISPNPATSGGTVAFSGHGTDVDGGDIFAYSWRSNIDGALSSSSSFSRSSLSTGQHTIYFKVQDLDGAWSTEASAPLSITSSTSNTENIYIALMFGAPEKKAELTTMLGGLGASQEGAIWKYTSSSGKKYEIRFVTTIADARQALYTENAHVILQGHANYGLGGIFTKAGESGSILTTVYYIDDDRVWNYSEKSMGINVAGLIKKQALPNWFPEYKDGADGIMPYTFEDPKGAPPHNYYITYKIPGDPKYYKVETVRFGAAEKYSGSGATPWFSENGTVPSASNPAHAQYFITNTDTSGDYGSCGANPCPKPHYGSRTILARKDLEIDPSNLKYKRLLFHSCSSLQYFLGSFAHGIVFYTTRSVEGGPSTMYLKHYLLGKSDEEIWEIMQGYQDGYDYYDFSKRPSEQ